MNQVMPGARMRCMVTMKFRPVRMEENPSTKAPRAAGSSSRPKASPESARLIVVSSAEFLDDTVLGISQNLSRDRYLYNLQLVLNAVDWAVEDEDLLSIRSRGTPRIANRLLRRVRDYATVRADGTVDLETAIVALAKFEVDDAGLDKVDRFILGAIVDKFGGGPVGLSTLAIAVGEEPETVEDAYEPYLLQQGFLQRTPRGRIATQRAYDHLGLEMPHGEAPNQGRLID